MSSHDFIHLRFPELGVEQERLLPRFNLDTFLDKNYLTHGLHPYPAKFIPQIPSRLIDAFTQPGEVVFDPFCGSGTSLVEARLLNRKGIGADLNPLSVMISQAKTYAFSPEELATLSDIRHGLSLKLLRYLNGKKFGSRPVIPSFKNQKHWFCDLSMSELGFIKQEIAKHDSPSIHAFLSAVFSAIIVKASNQESDTRWKAVNKNLSKGDVLKFFLDKLADSISRSTAYSKKVRNTPCTDVVCADARYLSFLPTNSVDFVVTSPPYMNSYDYYLYHKLRMFWLDIDHYSVQANEIGSRNKHSDKKLGEEVFVREMQKCLSELSRVLKPQKFAALVVGDSILRGKLLRMDEIYKNIGSSCGLELRDTFIFEQRRYTKSFTKNYKKMKKNSYILLFSV